MDTSLKVTDQPREAAFEDVVAGDNVINIPLFQRAYRWEASSLNELFDDVQEILDEKTASQFLGVLVMVPQTRSIGTPVLFDVVDGQQRLSTCYLFLLAIAQVAARNGAAPWAIELVRTYLLIRPFSDFPYNTRLVPAFADRQQFKTIWDRFRATPALTDPAVWQSQPQPMPPAPAGPATGRMLAQFDRLVRRLTEIYKQGGQGALEKLAAIVIGRLSFVQISLQDPTAAPKIFERLNARGERITTSDLVRNEIFARVASDPALAQAIFSNSWEPFIGRFSNAKTDLDGFLFPYGLVIDPATVKVSLFKTLRSRWAKLTSTQEIIGDMARYASTYLALEAGVIESEWPVSLRHGTKRLHDMGAPSSIYPFLFQLVTAVIDGDVAEDASEKIVALIESFLFRRAVCGYEPTGLHSVFKGMWKELGDRNLPLDVASVADLIRERKTVSWPNDEEFRKNIIEGDLYHRRIVKFALRQYEEACEGESPKDDFEVEHIAPQAVTDHWNEALGDDHATIVDAWGNLVPNTREMNLAVGQKAFQHKCEIYKDSMFASTRDVGKRYQKWEVDDVLSRGVSIANWAVERWASHLSKS